MEQPNPTRLQIEKLGNPFIGIELLGGQKIFGRVDRFTRYKIYVRDKHEEIKDVPRRMIKRAFLLLKGENYGGEEFPHQNKSAGQV
jgi:hypothetical protein